MALQATVNTLKLGNIISKAARTGVLHGQRRALVVQLRRPIGTDNFRHNRIDEGTLKVTVGIDSIYGLQR